jgi:bacterioferritin (cytochrome b1)
MRVESDVTKGGAIDADAVTGILNKFLRGELSAVETYRQAIDRLAASACAADLTENKRSHEQRVEMLRNQVLRLGGTPADDSGAWGSFAKLIEGGAKLFGEKAAIAALEEGEDHGLKLYRSNSDIAKLDLATRDFVERSLLPEQERSHRTTSRLKHAQH